MRGRPWGPAAMLGAGAVLLSLGCVNDLVPTRPGSEASTGDPGSASTTSPDPSTTSGSTSALADASSTTAEEPPPVPFIAEPDQGSGWADCDIFTQDCPAGQKCTPAAYESDGWWNLWRCRPIADDPAGVDEPCQVEGHYYSGFDDCELGSMCWDVDPETHQGTCVPLCVGGWDELWSATCEDPDRACTVHFDAVFAVCLPVCDPLQQDCPEGQSCIPPYYYGNPQCVGDASGAMGAYGDPCEYENMCDPGLVCLEASSVPPGCGASSCCTELCDLFDPLGDLQCTGAAEGQQCLPWYEPGEALPGHEDVGVCALP